MAATGFSLSDALNAIGVARVFIGDPFTAGGLTSLPTEGEIRVGVSQTLNRLTAPEHTGEVAHDAWVVPGQVSITVPVIYGDATLFSTLSAHGASGEGYSAPQRPTYTSLVIIPLLEMDTTVDPPTISYDGTTWAPAAPTRALWFWKTVPQRPEMGMAWDNGGKVIVPVTFEAFFAGDTGDYAGIPDGQKVYTYGDPASVANGVTGLLI